MRIARWRLFPGRRAQSPGTSARPWSAIIELEEALAGGKSRSIQLYERLTGSEQLWWRCCRDAAQSQPYWLQHGDHDKALQVISDTELVASRGVVARAAEAADLVCRALVAPVGPARPASALSEAVAQAADCWDSSPAVLMTEEPVSTPELAAASAHPALRDRVRQVLACLDNVSTDAGQAMVAICALLLAAEQPDAGRTVRVPVVFARPGEQPAASRGVAGTLELREFPPGPPGLFPDPRGMRNRRADSLFDAGLGLAWQFAAGAGRGGRCVLWRLSLDAGVPDYAIDGGSLGAAFAVALRELLRRPRGSRPGLLAGPRAFFVGLRPRCAITGVLATQRPPAYGKVASPTADGPWLDKVGDMDAKLDAAKAKGLRLVAPAANRASAHPPATVTVDWAETIHQADRYARRVRPARVAVTAAALIAVAGTSVGISAAVHFESVARAASDQAARQTDDAAAGELITQSEALGDTSPTASRIESLAAWHLDPDPQSQYALISAAVLPGLAILSSGPTDPMTFSPDGRILATVNGPIVNGDGTAQLWNTATHQPIGQPFTAEKGMFMSALAFGPDGKTLAIGGYNGQCGCGGVQLWNVAAHRQVNQPITVSAGNVNSVAFSPDGRTLAIGTDGGTILWDVATRRAIGRPIASDASDLAPLMFSPNGKILAIANEIGAVQLWDVATHRPAGSLPIASTDEVTSMAFSPDGKTLATGFYSNTVQMWDTATDQRTGTLSTSLDSVSAVAFSPDGQILAVGGTGGTALLDIAAHQQLSYPFDGQTGNIYAVAFSPNGQTLATGGATTTWLWDMTQQVGTPLVGPAGGTASKGAFGGAEHTLAFSPNGQTLATMNNDGTVRLWDAATGRPVGHPLSSPGGANSMAFSPDGQTLAIVSAHGTGTTWLWDLARQTGEPFTRQDGGWESVAFSPDGRTLATDSLKEGGIQLWDVATRRQVGPPLVSAGAPESISFSPDGRTLVIGNGTGTYLWDVATHRPVGPPISSSSDTVSSNIAEAVFSPDGKTIATVDLGGTVWLWDVATRRHTGEPIIAPGGAVSVTFSPDGRTLATVDQDGTVRLWDVATQQQIGEPLSSTGGANSVAFSPDGKTLAIGNDEGVELWDVTPLSQALAKVCGQIGGNVTQAEWQLYVPAGIAYSRVCP